MQHATPARLRASVLARNAGAGGRQTNPRAPLGVGTKVMIMYLKSHADLNGREGEIVTMPTTASQPRFGVRVHGEAGVKMIQKRNFELLLQLEMPTPTSSRQECTHFMRYSSPTDQLIYLMFQVGVTTPQNIRERLSTLSSIGFHMPSVLNRNHWQMGIFPLLVPVLTRPDDDAYLLAKVLLHNGADVNMMDSGPGVTALFTAAQEGKPKTLALFLKHGANVEHQGRLIPTQCLGIAVQNGHFECVAKILHAAHAKGKLIKEDVVERMVDLANGEGRTPARIAAELARVEIAGALVALGADLSRAAPHNYSCINTTGAEVPYRENSPAGGLNPDGTPEWPIHYALDKALQSQARKVCAECNCSHLVQGGGEEGETGDSAPNDDGAKPLSRCGGCSVPYYCGAKCQKQGWKKAGGHKLVCKRLAVGREAVRSIFESSAKKQRWEHTEPGLAEGGTGHAKKGKAKAGMGKSQKAVAAGFQEPFGPLDMKYMGHPGNYDRDSCPVWEYDASRRRGVVEWTRYPPRIESALESLGEMGAPKLMYRPGQPHCDGRYERESYERGGLSKRVPPGCASRHVFFDDMTEREIYVGSSRPVRRNGIRKRPELASWAMSF